MRSGAPQPRLPHVDTRVGCRYRNSREQQSAITRYLVIRTETPTRLVWTNSAVEVPEVMATFSSHCGLSSLGWTDPPQLRFVNLRGIGSNAATKIGGDR
jgi:hypothetical protein